jgi:choline-glycine betaine transporter
MPRLVGKKNNSALYTALAMLIAAAGAVALEYFGVIDFLPDFGKDAEVRSNSTSQPVRTNKPVN